MSGFFSTAALASLTEKGEEEEDDEAPPPPFRAPLRPPAPAPDDMGGSARKPATLRMEA